MKGHLSEANLPLLVMVYGRPNPKEINGSSSSLTLRLVPHGLDEVDAWTVGDVWGNTYTAAAAAGCQKQDVSTPRLPPLYNTRPNREDSKPKEIFLRVFFFASGWLKEYFIIAHASSKKKKKGHYQSTSPQEKDEEKERHQKVSFL